MPQLDLSRAVWRKSRRSNQNGACVEVSGLSGVIWRKSRRSTQNGACVEVTASLVGGVGVRDSKDPGGGVLVVSREDWRGFVHRVVSGDLPAQ